MNKITTLLRFDFEMLLANNLGFFEKTFFILKKYFSILLNKRKIKYLGRDFCYDGRFSPIPLQMYPREIEFLNKNIDLKKVDSVLDIGANIGQFTFSLKHFFPNLKSFCYEPNKNIFQILEKNLSYFDGVKLFNFGVGKSGKRNFYYSPSSSGLGSFYEENVNVFGKKEDIKKINVEIIELNTKNLKELKSPSKFDLVKIDVEGAEIEVLKSLKGIDCEYILLEVSVDRKGNAEISEVVNAIEKNFGRKTTILDSRKLFKNAPSIDILFKLEK